MNINNQSIRPKNIFSRLTQGLLLACLVLGFGFAELQAQDGASFYNSIDGELTNDVTIAPGESFTLTISVENLGLVDGVTATLLFDPNLLQVEGEAFTDLVGFQLPVPFAQEVDNETGWITFSKALFGPGIEPGSFDYMEMTFIASEEVVYNTDIQICHMLTGNDMSSIVYFGSLLLTDAPCANVTIFTGLEAPDCLDLGLNIGDDCEDENGAVGIVNADCECEPTVIYDCEDLEANIGDACEDDNGAEGTVSEDCLCDVVIEPVDCLNDLAYLGADLDGTNNLIQIASCSYQEEYSTITNVVGGSTYEFTASGDSYITVRTGTFDGPVIAAGYSPLSVTPEDDSDLFPHWNTDENCGTASSCIVTTVQCTSCLADCPDGSYFGDACDDLDETTYNDIIGTDCECAGTPYDCIDQLANIGDACDDGDPLTIGDVVTEDCGCAGQSTEVEIACGQDLESTYCYGINEATPWLYTGEEGETLNMNFASGFLEGGYDDIVIYDGNSDAAPVLYSTTDIPTGSGAQDLSVIDVNSTGNQILMVVTSDGSVSCGSGSTAYIDGWAWTVSCNEAVDCPEIGLNIGDACDDGNPDTGNDTVSENCECIGEPIIPSDCEEWVMYMNDNEGGETDIYSVDISSGDAELTYITTVGFHAHIAYNPENNLIYVMHNENGSYVTVNPHVMPVEVSDPVFLAEDVLGITTAAFAPNGNLLVGSATEDVIYNIDLIGLTVSVFDSYAPVSGGDIEFDDEGMLYLATRSGNGLYQVWPDGIMDDVLLNPTSLPNLVTGMALTEGGQLLMSHNGNADLFLRNTDGTDTGLTFPLMLDGDAFMHHNGDMTSGCNSYQVPNEGDCEAFSTFYVNEGNEVDGTDLYSVMFVDEDANLTFLTNVTFNAHIAYNGADDIVYFVNIDGSFIRAYDPTSGIFLGDLPIDGDIDNLFSVVYDDISGLLYVGDDNDDEVYSIDLGTGTATYFADAPIQGGDLAIQGGSLYLATRADDKLYEITGGGAVEVGSIPVEVNGMAHANNADDLIIANFGSTMFTQISAADGSTIGTYNAMLDGSPFTMYNGDMAAGCGDDESENETGNNGSEVDENSLAEESAVSTITSYPNPTAGNSQVVFVTADDVRTLVEVYDMNGRNVETLFNQVTEAGLEYRVDFNGSALPNGVYIYRMTTDNETIINKFMIAK